MKTIEFSFELNKDKMKRINEKSYYNQNYYELDISSYGDYILPRKCNILFEEAEDYSYHAYYSLGYFDDNDNFQAMWTWCDTLKMDL